MKMRKCLKCGKYTFKEICEECKIPTVFPKPPRYSPTNKYGKYRRMVKKI